MRSKAKMLILIERSVLRVNRCIRGEERGKEERGEEHHDNFWFENWFKKYNIKVPRLQVHPPEASRLPSLRDV